MSQEITRTSQQKPRPAPQDVLNIKVPMKENGDPQTNKTTNRQKRVLPGDYRPNPTPTKMLNNEKGSPPTRGIQSKRNTLMTCNHSREERQGVHSMHANKAAQ
jgi:hypothetical protein